MFYRLPTTHSSVTRRFPPSHMNKQRRPNDAERLHHATLGRRMTRIRARTLHPTNGTSTLLFRGRRPPYRWLRARKNPTARLRSSSTCCVRTQSSNNHGITSFLEALTVPSGFYDFLNAPCATPPKLRPSAARQLGSLTLQCDESMLNSRRTFVSLLTAPPVAPSYFCNDADLFLSMKRHA